MKPRAQEEFREPTPARVGELLGSMVGRRVLVVGDSALDAYVAGEVERISPEAPVPVVRVQDRRYALGGAANVAANVAAIGAEVTLVATVGDDRRGEQLRTELVAAGIRDDGIVVTPERPTTSKTRVVARGQHRNQSRWCVRPGVPGQ